MSASQRLKELGIELPAVAKPLAAYVPALRDGDFVYVSGQLPMVDGALQVTGHVGAEVTPEDAKVLARTCALNAIAAAASVLPGGVDDIVRITKVVGFVSAVPSFTAHPGIVNGASELLGEVFGEAGAHVRCALGVASLPLGAPVEVEVTFRVA